MTCSCKTSRNVLYLVEYSINKQKNTGRCIMTITQEDRNRFFDLMNENDLSWEEFWNEWEDHDVELMVAHGG